MHIDVSFTDDSVCCNASRVASFFFFFFKLFFSPWVCVPGCGWVSSRGHQPDGAWSVDGGDVARVGRMRPAGGGAGTSWSLALTDGTTMVMTASSAEVADIWVSNLKVLLREGSCGGGAGKYSYNGGGGSAGVDARVAGESGVERYRSFGGTAPTLPVSPQRATNSSAFGTVRTLF